MGDKSEKVKEGVKKAEDKVKDSKEEDEKELRED
jgi:hypothetical protein